jgi:hypothetical protein
MDLDHAHSIGFTVIRIKKVIQIQLKPIFQSHIINPEILVSNHLPKTNPWSLKIRQAFLNGTAILED